MITAAQLPVVIGAGAFGLVFGSFVTALSYRLPRHISIADGRSRCPHCGHALAARDMVPVLSWVAHGGKCRHCSARISWRYPLIELISMTLFVSAAIVFGDPILGDPVRLAVLLAMTPTLLALAVIDLEQRILPNVLIAILVPLLLLWRWRVGSGLLPGVELAAAVFVAAVAVNVVAGRVAVGKPPLMGSGDGKFLAVAALALPLPQYFLFMTVAGFLGLLSSLVWRWRTGESRFPFGPAIAAALWLVLAATPFLPF